MRLTARIDRGMSKQFSFRYFGSRFTILLQRISQFDVLEDVVVGGSQNPVACFVFKQSRCHRECNIRRGNFVFISG